VKTVFSLYFGVYSFELGLFMNFETRAE